MKPTSRKTVLRYPDPELSPEAQIAQAYRDTFTTAAGQVVLDDLRKSYGQRRSFVRGETDTTAFHEGQRDVFRRIEMYLDPENQEAM